MGIRILHIADMHLGRRFQDHPEAAEILSEARYKTLENVITLAVEREADIVTVGGDLFDRRSMGKAEVQRAARILNRFTGKAVLVLPGNHDYISEGGDLWQWFKEAAEEHILLLEREEPVSLKPLGIDALVYPGPCRAKHSAENGISWIKEVEKKGDLFHIGIAHGSIEGVSPDFEQRYYPMTQQELKEAGVDIWLLGHTHVTWPEKPDRKDFIFNPGTPEPDGFSCRHSGRAFFITVDNSGEEKDGEIEAQILNCGSYRFEHRNVTLRSKDDVEKLLGTLKGSTLEGGIFEDSRYRGVVLHLTVEGRLEPEVYEEWKKSLPQLRDSLLELKLDDGKLLQSITMEQVRGEFPSGSFPEKLLSRLHKKNDEQGMQLAYELICSARENRDETAGEAT